MTPLFFPPCKKGGFLVPHEAANQEPVLASSRLGPQKWPCLFFASNRFLLPAIKKCPPITRQVNLC